MIPAIAFILSSFLGLSSSSESATIVTVVAPMHNGGLSSDYRAIASARGTCWIGSLSAEREDAWRCMAGNVIYDPCFATAFTSRIVACMAGDYFSRRVVIMRLNKSLPIEMANRNTMKFPFALLLLNGARCTFITGATETVAGRRLNYACTRGEVYGFPNRSRDLWSVYWSARYGTDLQQVPVLRALF